MPSTYITELYGVIEQLKALSAPTDPSTGAKQSLELAKLDSIITSLSGIATSAGQAAEVARLDAVIAALSGKALDSSLQSLLGRYTADTATVTTSLAILTTPAVKICSANPNRKGLIIYNNSANSIYIKYGSAGTGSDLTRILATFAQFVMEQPIYRGDIYAVRNAGTGSAVITELT